MRFIKNKCGITLISVVVTIIVLLILVGVSIRISNLIIINNAVDASAKNDESLTKEQVEFAYFSADTGYIADKNTLKISKEEYFVEEISKFLENETDYTDVEVTSENTNIFVSFSCENQNYNFTITESGKIYDSIIASLKENVKIGDYIEYPVEYKDVYTGKEYTKDDGWRVIDDGSVSGYVRIISTGIPIKWKEDNKTYSTLSESMNALKNNFGDLVFIGETLRTKVYPNVYEVENCTNKISTIDIEDIEKMDESSELLKCDGTYEYWIAGATDSNDESYFYSSELGIETTDKRGLRIGVRPVIYLNENLTGSLKNNKWEIVK